ncbi:MAG TPA: ATP-dependent metallopeptidase FtsH/Yme1/Tma family protein, partial [Thermoleophilia bacterium]|nr:ATP-dependent metallopeptidase FtsH/Yme1/Tma family protein [Thermoleophilia bacterium]
MADVDQQGRSEQPEPGEEDRQNAHYDPSAPERADRKDAPHHERGKGREGGARDQSETGDRPPWHVEGGREAQRPGDDDKSRKPSPWRYIIPVLVIALLVNWLIVSLAPRESTAVTIPYSAFVKQVDAGNVASVTTTGLAVTGSFKKATEVPIVQTSQRRIALPGGTIPGETRALTPAAGASAAVTPGAAPTTAGAQAKAAGSSSPAATATPGGSGSAASGGSTRTATAAPTATVREFATQLPAFGTGALLDRLVSKGVTVTAKPAA